MLSNIYNYVYILSPVSTFLSFQNFKIMNRKFYAKANLYMTLLWVL